MTTLGNDVRSGRPGEVGGEHRSYGNGCYVAARWSALGQVAASLLEAGILDFSLQPIFNPASFRRVM